jgi:Family of unknown function (DUF6527)
MPDESPVGQSGDSLPTPEQRIEMDEASYRVSGLRGPGNRELYVIEQPYGDDSHPSHGMLLHHPGAMWRYPVLDADNRECWVIVLPNRAGIWWTTYKATNGGLWTVTGEPPRLTVQPSINAGDGAGPGNWHGWVKDGVMTP